jgi:hypothetical protein
LATYYVNLASGYTYNDGLTETGYWGFPEFTGAVNTVSYSGDTFKLYNTGIISSDLSIEYFNLIDSWYPSSPWMLLNSGSEKYVRRITGTRPSLIKHGIIDVKSYIQFNETDFQSCYLVASGNSSGGIRHNETTYSGCTLYSRGLNKKFSFSNSNRFIDCILNYTGFLDDGQTTETWVSGCIGAGASGSISPDDTLHQTNCTWNATLPTFPYSIAITETGLMVRLPTYYSGYYVIYGNDLYGKEMWYPGAVSYEPRISISYPQLSGAAPRSILFSVNTNISSVVQYTWDFDNGSGIISGVTPTGYFPLSGTYDINVTASGTDGDVAVSSYMAYMWSPTEIFGDVKGQDYIFTLPNFDYFTYGSVYGEGKIFSILSFIYPESDEPPTSSGTLAKSFKAILTNKYRHPYKTPYGTIVSKIDVLSNGRLSYLENLPVELWMNYTGGWSKYEDAVTDRYGSCYVTHLTTNIANITNCLGIAKVIYNDGYYVSNVIRYNFYSGIAFSGDLVYIIDALASGVGPDRVSHDIFDGSGRSTFFDRMFYI